jgi:hypothetical protein
MFTAVSKTTENPRKRDLARDAADKKVFPSPGRRKKHSSHATEIARITQA